MRSARSSQAKEKLLGHTMRQNKLKKKLSERSRTKEASTSSPFISTLPMT